MAFEIDPVEDLQAAVDWFVEVVPPKLGVPYGPPVDPASVEVALARIDAAIAPLVLPPEIRWFWQTWDEWAFEGVMPAARVSDPAFALDGWTLGAVDGMEPRALFPIGYESHGFLLVDLTDSTGAPASAWTYGFGDFAYELAYPSLAALLRSCAERAMAPDLPQDRDPMDAGARFERYDDAFRDAHFTAIVDRHFAATAHRRATVAVALDAWPDRWRSAEQAVVSTPRSDGPTHTVAQFVQEIGKALPRAVLRGQIHHRFDAVITLADHTGSVPLVVQRDQMPAGWAKAVEVEVEVTVHALGPIPAPPSTSELAEAALDHVDAMLSGVRDEGALVQAAQELARAREAYANRVPVVERMVITQI